MLNAFHFAAPGFNECPDFIEPSGWERVDFSRLVWSGFGQLIFFGVHPNQKIVLQESCLYAIYIYIYMCVCVTVCDWRYSLYNCVVKRDNSANILLRFFLHIGTPTLYAVRLAPAWLPASGTPPRVAQPSSRPLASSDWTRPSLTMTSCRSRSWEAPVSRNMTAKWALK